MDTDSLPPPGTQPFLPSLLNHVRLVAPGFPLEPVIVQVLLLCIISGNKNLILRTRDDDVALVSKLAALVRIRFTLLRHAKPRGSPTSRPRTHMRYINVSLPGLEYNLWLQRS